MSGSGSLTVKPNILGSIVSSQILILLLAMLIQMCVQVDW